MSIMEQTKQIYQLIKLFWNGIHGIHSYDIKYSLLRIFESNIFWVLVHFLKFSLD